MSQFQPPQPPYPQQNYGPQQQPQWGPPPPSQPLPQQSQWNPQQQWQPQPTQPQWQQPMPQPPQKPRKSRKRLWVIIGIVVLAIIVIGVVASQGGKNAPTTDNSQATQPATTQQQSTQSASQPTQPAQRATSQPAPSTHNVGAPVVVSDTWTVTVNSVKKSSGSEFTTPKSGDTFIVVDVTLKNTSSSNQGVSSLGMFNLKDSTGQQYTETITDFTKAPDGTIAPGELLRGQLVYEVPVTQHSFTFSFQSDFSGSDLTEWNVNI